MKWKNRTENNSILQIFKVNLMPIKAEKTYFNLYKDRKVKNRK